MPRTLAYNDGELNTSQTRSLLLPVLYWSTHGKVEFQHNDAICAYLALQNSFPMNLEGSHTINAPRALVYASLIDPEILQQCIPGCESLQRTSPDTYAMTIRAGVGSIKGLFNGTVRMEDLREPEHYRLVIEGKGRTGFLKGSGDLDLIEEGETTVIRYSGEMQVGGMIASVGQRMVLSAARMMASQFFAALEEQTLKRN